MQVNQAGCDSLWKLHISILYGHSKVTGSDKTRNGTENNQLGHVRKFIEQALLFL